MGLHYCTALSAGEKVFTEKDERGEEKNQTGLLVVGTLFVHTGILQEWRTVLGLQWVEEYVVAASSSLGTRAYF